MYPYRPLAESQIRTLHIFPAIDAEDDIRCELHHQTFSPGTYNALSYVWGNPNPRKRIYIDDEAVEVNPNLFAALRNLRDTNSKMCLWVDALCINQLDDEEKTSQVKQMTEIYINAMTVLMWLGESDDDSDLAMTLLQNLEEGMRGIANGLGYSFYAIEKLGFMEAGRIFAEPFMEKAEVSDNDLNVDSFLIVPESSISTPLQPQLTSNTNEEDRINPSDKIAEALCSENFDNHWKALAKLIWRPNWIRTWIIQEIVVSHQTILCCGSLRASWNYFMLFLQFINRLTLNKLVTIKMIWGQYAQLYFDRFVGQKPSLLEGLIQFRRYCASDARDRIYAILNLVDHKGFEPDYTKTIFEAYRDVAKFIIEQDQTLDILSACKPCPFQKSLLKLHSKIEFKESLDQIALITNPSALGKDHLLNYQRDYPMSLQSIITNLQEALLQITESTRYLDALYLKGATTEKESLHSVRNIEVVVSNIPSDRDIAAHCRESQTRLRRCLKDTRVLQDVLLPGISWDAMNDSQRNYAKVLFTKSLEDIGLNYEEYIELRETALLELTTQKISFSRLKSFRPGLMHPLSFESEEAKFMDIHADFINAARQLHTSLTMSKPSDSKTEKASLDSENAENKEGHVVDELLLMEEIGSLLDLINMFDYSTRVDEREDMLDSHQKLYDTFPKLLNHEKFTDLLFLGKKGLKITSDSIFPSWVPDWRTQHFDGESLIGRNPRNCHYKAGGSTPSFHFPNDENILIVDGLSLGSVCAMKLYKTESFEDKVKDEWNIWLSAKNSHHPYGSQKYQQEAFIRTLAVGRNIDGSKGTCGLTARLLDNSFNMGFVEVDKVECNTQLLDLDLSVIYMLDVWFKFGITDSGFMARIPSVAERGDIISIILGAKTPLVLRRYEKLNGYIVIGECCKFMAY